MKLSHDLLVCLVTIFLILGDCYAQTFEWVRTVGGPEDVGFSVSVDADGNSYITGYSEAGIIFGNMILPGDGAFVAKFNTSGTVLWAKQTGSSVMGVSYRSCIALDQAGDCYLTGSCISKYDSPGNKCWAICAATNVPYSTANNAIVADRCGNIYVIAGINDASLAKYNTTQGQLLWLKQFAGASCSGITLDKTGNAYVTGFVHGVANLGTTNISTGWYDNTFTAKYSSDGELSWFQQAKGETKGNRGNCIATDAEDNCYVTGFYYGTVSFNNIKLPDSGDPGSFLAKYSNAGELIWVQNLGTIPAAFVYGIAVDAAGNCFITGQFNGDINLGYTTLTNRGGGFIAKYSASGVLLWFQALREQNVEIGFGIGLDKIGDIFVAGRSGSDLMLLKRPPKVPPRITIQPKGQTATGGDKVILSVGIDTFPCTFQWQKDGANLNGQTNSTLELSIVQRSDYSTYTVVISDSDGSVTSLPATLAPEASDTIIAWGSNSYGQTNVPTGLAGVLAIASGGFYSLALKSNGVVAAWGLSDWGQTNVPAGLSNVLGIAAGSRHCLAVKRDGKVVAWGGDGHGQTRVPPDLTNAIAVAAGQNHSMALKRDGSLIGWILDYAPSIVPSGLRDVVAISAGPNYYNLALKENGTLVEWPNPDAVNRIPAGLSNVVAIATGDSHRLALKADGTVVAWGYTSGNLPAFVPPGLMNVVAIAAGGNNSLALKEDGTVVAWGDNIVAGNSAGQTKVPPWLKNVVGIASGQGHCLALCGNGSPAITAQPNSRTGFVFGEISLNVKAAGIPPLRYQWQFNGTNLVGATSSSLILTNLRSANSGSYQVMVHNTLGSTNSKPALLRIDCCSAIVNGQKLTTDQAEFVNSARVELEIASSNAAAFYTLDGSAPTYESQPYTGPFTINQSLALRVIVYSADFLQSCELVPIILIKIPTYALSVINEGGGSVSINPPNGPYMQNTAVNIVAIPEAGWKFLRWLRDVSGTNPTATITITGNETVQAVFGTTLSVTSVGGGSVTVDPPGGTYPYGTEVRLTALPAAGNYFFVWDNPASGNTRNPLSFRITNPNPSNSALFGVLKDGQYALTTVADGLGQVVVSPQTNRFANGQIVTLTAVADAGQDFVQWTSDASATINPLVVVMDRSKIFTAQFTKRPLLKVGSFWGGMKKGGFQISLLGEFDQRYGILASEDLADWTPLVDATNSFGVGIYTDSTATNFGKRFYRAIRLP